MSEMQAETIDSKEALIDRLSDLASIGNIVFRGYSQQRQMLPRIISERASNIEMELLKEFEKYAMQYMSVNNPIDFLSNAQHFGLSTRLLDFTYNPFVALYFALFKQKSGTMREDDKLYYYIRYCNLDEQICLRDLPKTTIWSQFESNSMMLSCHQAIESLTETIADINSSSISEYLSTIYDVENPYSRNDNLSNDSRMIYINKLKSKFADKRILFIDSNQSNQRIVMQQGIFLFPYTLNGSELKFIIDKNTRVIKIHKNLRGPMQHYLNTLGINAYRLMPDLSSICEAVERKVKEESYKKK